MKNILHAIRVLALLCFLGFFLPLAGQAPVISVGKAQLGGVYTQVYVQRISEVFEAHDLVRIAWEDFFFYGKNEAFSVDVLLSECDNAPLATVIVATNRSKEEAERLLNRVLRYILEGRLRD